MIEYQKPDFDPYVSFTDLSHFIFLDKYATYLPEEGRRETWEEASIRATEALRYLSDNKLTDAEYQEIFEAIYKQEVSPSMRLFSMPLDAIKRDHSTIFNCSFIGIDCVKSISEILYLSMSGVGVGFSLEPEYIIKLPSVKKLGKKALEFEIEDTQIAWAESLEFLINALYAGHDVKFNYDLIRPAGAILKTKNGIASGPEVLITLHNRVREIFKNAQGRKLFSDELLDICTSIADCAVSGGSRRSALICIFDPSDERILRAKKDGFYNTHPWRMNSNNSIAIGDETTIEEINNSLDMLFGEGTGEPGLFSKRAAYNNQPRRRNLGKHIGPNPCFAPGTMVQTRTGHFPIEDLVGREVEIWNGVRWQTVDNFRVTATDQEMLKITLHDGSEIKSTPYHTFILENGERVQAEDLVVGDKLKITESPFTHGEVEVRGAYLKGFLLGDGTYDKKTGKPILYVYGNKDVCLDRLIGSGLEIEPTKSTRAYKDVDFVYYEQNNRYNMRGLHSRANDLIGWASVYKTRLPSEVFEWNLESKANLLAGIFDADGTSSDTTNGFMYQLCSIHKDFLLDIQLLLKTVGVNSKVALTKKGGSTDFNDGYGEYETHDLYRLTISQTSSITFSEIATFERLEDFSTKQTAYNLKARFSTIAKIEPAGIEKEVYCCTVEGRHQFSLTSGIDVGQCAEIILNYLPYESEDNPGGGEFCNLSTIIIRENDGVNELLQKAKVASIIGTIQSSAGNFPYLRSGWLENQENERLLGVCLSGICDNEAVREASMLQMIKAQVINTNKVYAEKLGIKQSAATTSVKPSGNSSLLYNMSPGINPVLGKYMIRTVVVNKNSSMFNYLYANGVPHQDHYSRPDDAIFSFPSKAPESSLVLDELSAIDQLELWKLVYENYTEHNVSISVTYKKDEIEEVQSWIVNNIDSINGIALFPAYDANQPYLPIRVVNEDEYHDFVVEFPILNWKNFYLYEQGHNEQNGVAECASGRCDINL